MQGDKEGVKFGTKSITVMLLSMPIVASDGHNLPRQHAVSGKVADATGGIFGGHSIQKNCDIKKLQDVLTLQNKC